MPLDGITKYERAIQRYLNSPFALLSLTNAKQNAPESAIYNGATAYGLVWI